MHQDQRRHQENCESERRYVASMNRLVLEMDCLPALTAAVFPIAGCVWGLESLEKL